MRISFLFLFILVSCAQTRVARKPSSDSPIYFGDISYARSFIQLFPAVVDEDKTTYYFYLQLRNSEGRYIDCDPSEISVKTKKGRALPFKTERLMVGRYYLSLSNAEDFRSGKIDFYVKGKPLKEQFNLNLQTPHKDYTRLTIVRKDEGALRIRLRLADKMNRPISIPEEPEIIIEGAGEIRDLRPIQRGIWEFSLVYGEFNQILYISVRAQGAYFPNLLRYQHVEK